MAGVKAAGEGSSASYSSTQQASSGGTTGAQTSTVSGVSFGGTAEQPMRLFAVVACVAVIVVGYLIVRKLT